MIKMVRIDERMIHGQVALIWSRQLGVDRIVVVNDKAANNPMQTATLKMAAPDTAKAIVLTREKAQVLFSDPRSQQLQILVIVTNPADARFVAENIAGVHLVNIGNYGKVGAGTDKVKINDNVFLDDQDVADLDAIAKKGIKVEYQLVPDQAVVPLSKLIEKERA